MRSLGIISSLLACACAPQTGLILEVQGPDGTSSVQAGVAELRLVAARPSYCGRWIDDAEASTLKVPVVGRDLEAQPVSILVTPDSKTAVRGYDYADPAPTAEPLRAIVLALDSNGQLLGTAEFDPVPFVYEEVRTYQKRIVLLARGAGGPAYVTDDGCVCAPGVPLVGNSTGQGCDALIPPSYDRLTDTAGCELPAGARLPLNVCDGQLYPGERQNRELPCFAMANGSCRVGRRVCNDTNGQAYDRECVPSSGGPVLPSSTFCDDYLACERKACADPEPCFVEKASTHKRLVCHLPIDPTAKDGAGQPCLAGGSWSTVIGDRTGAACVSTVLDGMKHSPVLVGWKKDATTEEPQLLSSFCPPTLVVGKVDADPAKVPGQVNFTVSIGDEVYDVTLTLDVVCSPSADSPLNRLRCEVTQ